MSLTGQVIVDKVLCQVVDGRVSNLACQLWVRQRRLAVREPGMVEPKEPGRDPDIRNGWRLEFASAGRVLAA